MDQDATQHHGQVGVAAQLFRRRVSQQDGQEIERGIAHEVDDLVGAGRIADQLERHQDGQHGLDHACCGQRGQDRGKDAGQGVDDTVVPLALGGGGCGGRGGAQHPAELLVHLRDLGTNDHLVLAVCLGNAHNTGQALDGIGIGFGFIFQVKAQTGDTMGGVAHVFGTAHQAEDLFCQCAVIFFFCHLQFLHDGLIWGDPEPAAQKLCVSHTGQPADRVEVDHTAVLYGNGQTAAAEITQAYVFFSAGRSSQLLQELFTIHGRGPPSRSISSEPPNARHWVDSCKKVGREAGRFRPRSSPAGG